MKAVDPEAARYLKNFPKFRGVSLCVDVIRRERGAYLEMALADLAEYAEVNIGDLVAAFDGEEDHRVGALLLSVIADIRDPGTIDLFQRKLTAIDESQRHWALRGLHNLATAEARQALWDARTLTLSTPAQTASFRAELAGIMAQQPGTAPRWWKGGIRGEGR